MHSFIKIIFISFNGIILSGLPVTAQEKLEGWHLQGVNSEFPTGIRAVDYYANPTHGKSRKVIVAILDSGLDIDHPDLKDNIWINPGEIAGNKIDDDGNGYIDDMHGWNFLGGPDGRSVVKESLEVTRVYAKERNKWVNVDPSKLKGKKKKEYEKFVEVKEVVETKLTNAKAQIEEIAMVERNVMNALNAAKTSQIGDSLDIALLEASSDPEVQMAARIIRNVEEQGVEVESIDWLINVAEEQFASQKQANEDIINYRFNPDYDSRKIIGDDYTDFTDRLYGNNIVGGEFSYHGTHVAGIVGAVRNNGIGVDGVADQVALMSLKIIPDGDERDKDLANAIIYAVDNGAEVINMSFGKGYSPEKFLVDNAMKYAAKKDVLLVLGAGNEGENIDLKPKFPNDTYLNSTSGPKNMLSVGALNLEGGAATVAEFSNYGKKEVDVFAPGVYIYSTTPDNTYEYMNGTSFASPVVTGVATMIRSRFPNLSAVQVKDIIIRSSRKLPSKVIQPGTFDEVSPTELGIGGAIDLPAAMQIASGTKGRRKSALIPKEYKGRSGSKT